MVLTSLLTSLGFRKVKEFMRLAVESRRRGAPALDYFMTFCKKQKKIISSHALVHMSGHNFVNNIYQF